MNVWQVFVDLENQDGSDDRVADKLFATKESADSFAEEVEKDCDCPVMSRAQNKEG